MANMNEEQKKAWADYFQLSAEILADEEKHYAEHWVNDHLDTPQVLVNIIETKIARAVLAERDRIRYVAEQWISEARGHDGECDCRKQSEMLENFINHDDFNEGRKYENNN
jgi:hypothetical protein